MKKSLLFLFSIISIYSMAQLNCEGVEYELSTFVETYEDIDALNSTSLSQGVIWDDPEWQFPIGFDFTFYNFTTSELLFLEDLLGAGVIANPNSLKSAANVMMPGYADYTDLGFANNQEIGSKGGLSKVSYLTEGEVGSQVFKLEWNNVGFYGEVSEGGSESFMNIQLWLYEADQSIEFRFGSSNIAEDMINVVFDGLSGPLSALVCSAPLGDMGDIEGMALYGDPAVPEIGYELNEEPQVFNEVPQSGQVYRFERNLIVHVEESLVHKIEVSTSPNPFVNQLNVLSNESINRIFLVDLTGKVILDQAVNSSNVSLDTSLLPCSLYFLKVQLAGGETITRKILK